MSDSFYRYGGGYGFKRQPPPPVDPRTFLFPFATDGLEAISGVPVDHQHASPQTEIINGQLVTYAADVPVISDVGVTGRAQNINRQL